MLSSQKPKKRSSLRRVWSKAKPLLALLVLAAIIILSLHVRKAAFQTVDTLSNALRLNWQVVVTGDGVSPSTSEAIEKWSLRHFNGLLPDFETAALQIRQHFGLESVQLFREGFHKVRVKVIPRIAVMRLQTKAGRLLSKDFYAFGKSTPEAEHLPLLQGSIFHTIGSEDEGGDWTAERLKDKQLRGAQYALELLSLLEEKNIKPTIFSWDEYRGMSVTMAKDQVEVLFGVPPYREKVSRLEQLLNERDKASKPLPQRVEMDFEGKAFIKERNDGTGRM